jgi:hypothetical protein
MRSVLHRPLLAAAILLVVLSSCRHEPLVVPAGDPSGQVDPVNPPAAGMPCNADSVYFANDVLPIFNSRCAIPGCHSGNNPPKGILLTSYASIMASGEIVPFDPSEGDIMEVITDTDPDDRMPRPPNAPLTTDQINTIRRWISQGARNNACSGGCDTSNVSYALSIAPLFSNTCVGCHNAGMLNGGVNLSNYGGARTVALNGRLNGAVNHLPGYAPMPLGGAVLSSCDLNAIRIWINAGAPEN